MKNKKAVAALGGLLLLVAAILAATRATRALSPSQAAQHDGSAQSATIKLTQAGYQPDTLKLQQGVPARLTFVRLTDKTCGKELLIPEYEIRRALPLNEPVIVEFTPRKSGEFVFTCGMGMLRGKLIVQ